jgi:cytochrome P450
MVAPISPHSSSETDLKPAEPSAADAFAEIPRMPGSLLQRLWRARMGGRVDMLSGLLEEYRTLGPVAARSAGLFRSVNLYGPDANRLVLLDREHIFSARRPWMMIMGRIFPNGLLLRDGQEHKHHRKIMHETFKKPILREYAERMNPAIEGGLDAFGASGGPVKAFGLYKILTLDMATSIFIGAELGPHARHMNKSFENMVAASMSFIRVPLPGFEFNRGLQGRKFMIDYLGGLLAGKRANHTADMFSRLARAKSEEGEVFEDQDVLDHMVFLMMAAHDTTTSTLTSMTYELARHPEWQERVRAESNALGKDRPDLDDLEQLEALTWVMNETLRMYPPLPVIPRVATAAFEWGGYRIPADTMIIISPIATHYMDEWWSEPRRFDPERMSPARAEQDRHTHSWIPFGGGVHMCIGRRFAETQIRLVMHHLVRRYRWSVPKGYTMPVQQAPISKPRDGLPVTFERLQ